MLDWLSGEYLIIKHTIIATVCDITYLLASVVEGYIECVKVLAIAMNKYVVRLIFSPNHLYHPRISKWPYDRSHKESLREAKTDRTLANIP